MGLDFSIGDKRTDVHWSYTGFHCFRERLAEAIGIDLDEMEGFGGKVLWLQVDDDLVPLLDHSDCDGEISPEDCAKVAARLREIVSKWPLYDEGTGTPCYDRLQAVYLAEAMEECANTGQPLKFL